MGHILILRGPNSTGNFGPDFQDALLRACSGREEPLKIITLQEISGRSDIRVKTRELKLASPEIGDKLEAQSLLKSIFKATRQHSKQEVQDEQIVNDISDGSAQSQSNDQIDENSTLEDYSAENISDHLSQYHPADQIGADNVSEDLPATLATSRAKTAKNRRKNDAAKKKKADAKLKGQPKNSVKGVQSAHKTDEEGKRNAFNTSRAEKLLDSTAASSNGTSSGLLFEVRSADGKGLGAFAMVDIHIGTDVLVEEALIKPSEDSYLLREALFMNLSKHKKQSVMTLQIRCSCGRVPCIDTPFMKLWIFNCCGDGNFGPYLYELASRFNHDCDPNLARGFSTEKYLIFRAKKNIKKGEELTVNYSMIMGTTETRRQTLLDRFDFDCRCQTCESGKYITVNNVQTSWLKGVQVPKESTHVANRHTKHDLLKSSNVEDWYSEMRKVILDKKNELLRTIHILAFGGDKRVSTFELREAMIAKAMQNIVQFLKDHDKFFLGEAVCNLYSDHELLSLSEAIEASYQYSIRTQPQE